MQENKNREMKFLPDPKPDYTGRLIQKKIEKQQAKAMINKKRASFYRIVWAHNPHKCYECGSPIPFFNKLFIHHLIEKREQKYYSISLDQLKNGVILCLMCHDQCRLGIDKLPFVKEATEAIRKEWERFRYK